MKNRGKRFTPPDPKQRAGREKATGKSYKRDEEFSRFLAKELEMEAPPESFSKAMGRVYAELPRDMPVRHYPFRSAMKSLATVAVLAVLFGVSLLGANYAYPQLTESLPGVGMLFKAMNGTKPEDAPQQPSPQPLVAEEKLAVPEFEPVSLPCEGDILEELAVENAWSDGEKLYLHMSLLAPESRLQTLSRPDGEPEGYIPPVLFFLTEAYRDVVVEIFNEYYPGVEFDDKAAGYRWSAISINGQKVESARETGEAYLQYSETNSALALRYEQTEEGAQAFARYTGDWVLEIPQSARGTDSLSVSLSLPQAFYAGVIAPQIAEEGTVADGAGMAILDDSFTGEFTVAVDKAGALEMEAREPDNGVEITQMSYTPAALTATLNLPFLGYYGYSLMPPSQYYGGPVPQTPYGMYAVLSREDGTALASQNLRYGSSSERGGPSGFQGLSLHMEFPAEKRQALVLTLYYFDPEMVQPVMESAGLLAEDLYNPVAAEFTLDLVEGAAAPSTNYESRGLIKPEAEMAPYTLRHPELQNGIYVQGAAKNLFLTDSRSELVSLCVTPDLLPQVQNWALQCYIGDELAQTVYACDVRDDSAYNETSSALGGLAVYNSGGGLFWREERGQSDYEDGDYAHLHFTANYPSWDMDNYGGAISPFTRIDLVDASTGEVILSDLCAVNRMNIQDSLCGGIYTAQAESALESEGEEAANPFPQGPSPSPFPGK